MAVTENTIREQLPGTAQKSVGSEKMAAGVIDESLFTETDVLANQARMMARARNGVVYENGDEFSENFVNHVRQMNMPKQYVHQRLSQDTINSIIQGAQQRDQQYIGNNADWTGYYLEPLAKFIVPYDTPFRNMLPRTASVGIDIENWRAITDVFGGSGPTVGQFILAQQTAPQKASYTWVNKSNVLRQLSFSDIVTIESELYGRMFEPDVRAKVAAKLAPSLMLGQEVWYLNAAQNLWAPAPVNTVTTSTSGGSLAAATYWIIVTAVNAQGETLAWSIPPASNTVPQAASIQTSGSTSTISFNINRVPNAVSYNVYAGTGSTQPANSAMWRQSASSNFGGASALNDPGGLASGYFTVTMSSLTTSGTAYSTVVSAGNTAVAFTSGGGGVPANQTLTFDGIQALTYLNAGALSTVGVGGETATVKRVSDTGGALAKTDIDNWLEAMYLNARANPEALLVSVKDHKALSNIITTSTNYRVNVQPTAASQTDLTGGGRATKWINQTTGRVMDIIMCPYLMQGTIVALSLTLPFQVAEIDKPPLRISTNREMWALEYPPDQAHPTQWMYGVYSSETMINQYLGGTGILTGIVTA
jgi:hypothetical protein